MTLCSLINSYRLLAACCLSSREECLLHWRRRLLHIGDVRQPYFTASHHISTAILSNLARIKTEILSIHSFHRHVENATIPCRSQELLPFLSVMYFFLPPFSANYSSSLTHLILPSISWSTSSSFCSQIHT